DPLIIASANRGIFISSKEKTHFDRQGILLPSKRRKTIHIHQGLMYVSVDNIGIYVSGDGGKFWLPINHNLENLHVNDITHFKEKLYIATNVGVFYLHKDRWIHEVEGDYASAIGQADG